MSIFHKQMKAWMLITFFYLAFSFFLPSEGLSQTNLWEEIKIKARGLSNLPFREPRSRLPSWLEKLSYAQWEAIRFDANSSLWREENLPFEIQFYHLGSIFKMPVTIFEVVRGQEKKIEFLEKSFFYGPSIEKKPIERDIGFAGFSVYSSDRQKNEYCMIAKFLGACFFQGLPCGQVPGITARTIAINTGLADGEEFPFFREFWLVKPKKEDSELELYSIVDSPSITQACRFIILSEGFSTVCKIDTQLFFRSSPKKIGIAPLSAMFEYGENGPKVLSDYRPQVHEADGLLIASATGDWTWTPLENPSRLVLKEIAKGQLLGFGLVQRNRLYDHYQDIHRSFQDMPSAWVQLNSGFLEDGRVELVEVPLKDDLNKNILLFWTPSKTPFAGQSLSFSYSISWLRGEVPAEGKLGKVISARVDRTKISQGKTAVLLSFKGESLEENAALGFNPVVHVLSGGELLYATVGWEAQEKTALLEVQIQENGREPLRVEGWLEKKGNKLTERWYQEFFK
ncbi:glucan biosynthesis protein D [Candidatus Methylacidiphilum fumarolicum]|uniref:Periplasmic glucans biosynthesis protein G n=3 Tax=Candidatus Methylacidiphilum fumarolicum TaxID=591154 RepID=I0JZP0_METFB|nr:glucan biosynthesis protein [Candidatus Methylacidiphilum fumarolicum]TFE70887.1 glucan biosynthesis protein D [Candidatus Methylacidiphilum fumarolicum]TFE77392.1 glucan biosynthesis protein D [Candidatus Methylacidiphilum fumarolicum]CAI9085265.1 Glucans biosynthesis protein G precursor [Candidatus Methylacidiphilum fumarolicum]CCG92709.1 Periplasmic glucans biosynthesis protein G [Methylacidiphilum fumariolicum SolV]